MSHAIKEQTPKLKIEEVPIDQLKEFPGNPRVWLEKPESDLRESLIRYGQVDPLLIDQNNVIIGGNFRAYVMKKIGHKTAQCVRIHIDEAKARELNLRLNKNVGSWSWELLAEFDEELLASVGFSSEELDSIFDLDETVPEEFDLKKELDKLDIKKISVQKGDLFKIGDSRILCGDSTIKADVLKLMGGEKADMVLTDPPYRLSYLKGGIRKGKPVTGFGAKRNRRYLETDELPPDFTEKWMNNVAAVAKPDFSIIVFELWRNIREIWGEMEKHFAVKNMIVWHVPTRHQNFAAKYRFFNKHDIALVGASGTVEFNREEEPDGLQETYETALYAVQGKPHWESYQKNKKIQPTDFIELNAADEKSSGQGIIFGVKPTELLIPYTKVLTKRGDLVLEPFMGSGSSMASAIMLKRRCYGIEKSATYTEVCLRRIELLTGLKREKVA